MNKREIYNKLFKQHLKAFDTNFSDSDQFSELQKSFPYNILWNNELIAVKHIESIEWLLPEDCIEKCIKELEYEYDKPLYDLLLKHSTEERKIQRFLIKAFGHFLKTGESFKWVACGKPTRKNIVDKLVLEPIPEGDEHKE